MDREEEDSLEAFAERIQRVFIEEAVKVYGQRVTDLWQNPKHMGRIEDPDGHARITGPCGDTMEVSFGVEGARIARAAFWTDGCGPSVATGSTVCELVLGKTVAEAEGVDPQSVLDALGGLPEESVHCAKLAADALQAAVADHLARRDDSPRPPVTEVSP